MIRVFLCISDFSMIRSVIDYRGDEDMIELAGISTTIPDDVESVSSLHVDVIVLQNSIDFKKSEEFMSKLQEDAAMQYVHIVHVFKELDSDTVHMLLQEGISQYLIEPYTPKQLLRMITYEAEQGILDECCDQNVECFASQVLINMALPVQLNGFSYIRTAAMLSCNSCAEHHKTMKKVYAETARMHHTTASRVEKSIRTAINHAYREQPERISIHDKKPTNSEIVGLVREKLKYYKQMMN